MVGRGLGELGAETPHPITSTNRPHRLLYLPGGDQALPIPGQAQGTKCTFYKGVERQGTPAGLVLSLHHDHHVEAVAGEIFALQDHKMVMIITSTVITTSFSQYLLWARCHTEPSSAQIFNSSSQRPLKDKYCHQSCWTGSEVSLEPGSSDSRAQGLTLPYSQVSKCPSAPLLWSPLVPPAHQSREGVQGHVAFISCTTGL